MSKSERRIYMTKGKAAFLFLVLSGFGAIAYAVTVNNIPVFDRDVSAWFYSLREVWLTPTVKGITYLGNWQTITLLCIFLLLFRKTREDYGYVTAIMAIVASLLNKGVKVAFQRPRPDVSLHLIEQGGYSFTSGHAITAFVVYGLLIYLVRRHVKNPLRKNLFTGLLLIPMIFVGLSRIYLGVHYPMDVLGGWLLGTALLICGISVYERLNQNAPGITVKEETL